MEPTNLIIKNRNEKLIELYLCLHMCIYAKVNTLEMKGKQYFVLLLDILRSAVQNWPSQSLGTFITFRVLSGSLRSS